MSVRPSVRPGRTRWTFPAASSPPPASRTRTRCAVSSKRSNVPAAAQMKTDPAIDFSAYPDAQGRFGQYGGSFVAETLMAPLAELTEAYLRLRQDPAFVAELDRDLTHYVGRPSPIYHAERLSQQTG